MSEPLKWNCQSFLIHMPKTFCIFLSDKSYQPTSKVKMQNLQTSRLTLIRHVSHLKTLAVWFGFEKQRVSDAARTDLWSTLRGRKYHAGLEIDKLSSKQSHLIRWKRSKYGSQISLRQVLHWNEKRPRAVCVPHPRGGFFPGTSC